MAPSSPRPHDLLEFFEVQESWLQQVLSAAMSRGADFADLYLQHARHTSLALEDGIVSSAGTGVMLGVGVRAVCGDQVGYAYTEDLSRKAMLEAAQTAATIAAGTGTERSIAIEPQHTPDRYPVDPPWEDVDISQRLPLLEGVESRVRELETAIQKVSAFWSDSDERVLIVTSDGAMTADRRPMAVLGCRTTACKDGVWQTNGSHFSRRVGIQAFDSERLDSICHEAVDRTMVLFEARRPPAGQMPVVLAAGASGILLHEAIGHGLEADFNRKGTSIYSTQMNQQVAPDFVTLVDDGTMSHDRGALNVDDEGTPVERTVLIENGILRSYLHDKISARHYGVESTGSGRRESYRCAPLPRMRSTYMLSGPHTYQEVVGAVDRGVLALTFTNGQVNIGGGDFTFYIKNGWLIEKGRLTAPLKDVNIIGNGPQALRDVQLAADDAKIDTGAWTCGKNGQGAPVSHGIPTVLVKSLNVGGVNE